MSIPRERIEYDDFTTADTIIIGKKYPEDITPDYVVEMIDRFYKQMTKWQLGLE